ncbi:MAG: hypothetical protein SGILL_001876 [Bacillariaceae sp.]
MYTLYSGRLKDNEKGNSLLQQRLSRSQQSSTYKPKEDKTLQFAVDDLLKEHQGKIPRKQWGVSRRDSYSTFSTAVGTPDTNLCNVTVDRRNGGFIPIEISFPTADAEYHPPMPLLQKSKVHLPDIFDLNDEDDEREQDIVFVLADEEGVSCSSSMEVVRKISSRFTSTVKDNHNRILDGVPRGPVRPSVNRAPSMGMNMAGPPPPRQPMHQLSILIRRAEI